MSFQLTKKRFHLFEFHDLDWFPETWRNYLTDLLRIFWTIAMPFKILESVVTPPYMTPVKQLKTEMQRIKATKIIDLCSGGGGPHDLLIREINRNTTFECDVILTDLYPNINAFKKLSASNKNIKYEEKSINAMDCKLEGFRTMFASFHHFNPKQAQQIIQSAVDQNQPIGIFEMGDRSIFSLIGTLVFGPIGTLFITLTEFKFSFWRLFWTYIIPVMPLLVMFDGTVSSLRVYSKEELQEILNSTKGKDKYEWKIGHGWNIYPMVKVPYLIGIPKNKIIR